MEKTIDLKNEIEILKKENADLKTELEKSKEATSLEAKSEKGLNENSEEENTLVISLSMQVAELSAELEAARQKIENIQDIGEAKDSTEKEPDSLKSSGRWGYG